MQIIRSVHQIITHLQLVIYVIGNVPQIYQTTAPALAGVPCSPGRYCVFLSQRHFLKQTYKGVEPVRPKPGRIVVESVATCPSNCRILTPVDVAINVNFTLSFLISINHWLCKQIIKSHPIYGSTKKPRKRLSFIVPSFLIPKSKTSLPSTIHHQAIVI